MVDCLREWVRRNQVDVDYLLFQKRRASNEFITSVKNDNLYNVMYETEDVVIFTSK